MGCEVVPDALMAIHGWWVGVHVGEVSVEPTASGLIGIVSDSAKKAMMDQCQLIC